MWLSRKRWEVYDQNTGNVIDETFTQARAERIAQEYNWTVYITGADHGYNWRYYDVRRIRKHDAS